MLGSLFSGISVMIDCTGDGAWTLQEMEDTVLAWICGGVLSKDKPFHLIVILGTTTMKSKSFPLKFL